MSSRNGVSTPPHARSLMAKPAWLRRIAFLTSAVFLWSTLFAVPAQVLARGNKPGFGAPKLIPAPVLHDDPAWHTIDYHKAEHSRPTVSAFSSAVLAAKNKPAARRARLTLLDEVGHLVAPVKAATLAAWKRRLQEAKKLSPSERVTLHVKLGEVELAQEEQPAQARWHFRQAQKLSARRSEWHGLAAYDAAIALFYEGAYTEARNAFRQVLTTQPGLRGFNRQTCALYLRHARACAGYHDERAALGIPEPPRLDPLCGASALAVALKAAGKPYDKKTVLANLRVTGRGSSLEDIRAGAQKLGLAATVVSADDKGLIALPKPLVAYVEHDHFISVLQADKQGVSYLCSDCGAWPGGEVRLTWKQWRKLEATLYGVFRKANSPVARVMSQLEAGQNGQAVGVQVASAARTPLAGLTAQMNLLRTLKAHTTVECGQTEQWSHRGDKVKRAQCGQTLEGLKCYVCQQCCATFNGNTSHSPHATKQGEPVNLATGEEEYTPNADLVVYNPLGPSVVWSRLYDSLRPSGDGITYEANDLGQGWSHPYNIGVLAQDSDPTGGGALGLGGGGAAVTAYLIEPNGARVALTASGYPSSTTPTVACTVQAGIPMQAQWNYNSVDGKTYFVITNADRSQWITNGSYAYAQYPLASDPRWHPLAQIKDRNGNAINLNYSTPSAGGYPLLTSITDKNNSALLTFNRATDGTGNLTSVADRYSRSVYYHCSSVSTSNVPSGSPQSYQELDHVSQVVSTGASSPPDRYVYGYQNVGNGENTEAVPLLHTITVPSPTGTGTQTGTINYEANTMGVSSVADAHGNSARFQQIDNNHTQVQVKDPLGNIVYRYTVGYDMNMSQTTVTNGKIDGTGANTQIVRSEAYADANDPYRPSQVQDGNGYAAGGAGGLGTWTYTWDSYGNCLTATTPRSVTTTNTVSYTNFALGEVTQTQTGTKQKTAFTYYEPSGLLHTVASPLPGTSGGTSNVTTTYAYSTLGNLTSVVTPGNGTVTSKTTTYGYTTDGAYSQSEALGQAVSVTDNLGKTSHARYDSQGRVTSAWDALGNTGTVSYNIVGQGTQSQAPATGQTGSGHETVQNTYLYPGGPLTQTKLYDESGTQVRQVSPVYGAEGEQLTATGDTLSVTTAYDALYRPKTITDGNSHVTQTSYNTTGYASQSQLANSDTYQATSWDANGNVLSSTDGRGTVINYVYNDVESRLTDIQYPTGSGLDVHIDYDSYGRAYSQTDSTGSKAATFDDLNLPLTVTTTYKNAAGTGYLPAKTLTYSYNADGSRSSLVSPAGTFSYSYDGRGLPSSVSNPASETFGWTYLDNGWLWTQTLGSAAKATYTYNALGQVTELAHRKQDMATTLLADFSGMSQDAVGNRVSLTASVPSTTAYSGSTSYTYSSKDQLTQESSTRASGYTNNNGFDGVGNPTTFKGSSQSFNSVNQNTVSSTITFDGNGNPSAVGGNALTWNVNDKPTSIGSVLTSGYSASGLRAWKQNASSVRAYFLYDGLIPVCELDGSGNVTAYNTVGANGLLARHVNGTGGGSVFYCFDPQGSVSVRVDSSGSVLSTHCNEAWGTQVSSGSGYSSDPYAGYGGQWGYYRDSETGLHLLGQRYYDVSAGRFLNRDPIGSRGGINLYAYCGSSPVMDTDAGGLMPALFDPGTGIGPFDLGDPLVNNPVWNPGTGAAAGGAAAGGEAGGAFGCGSSATAGIIGIGIYASIDLGTYISSNGTSTIGPFTAGGHSFGNWVGGHIGDWMYPHNGDPVQLPGIKHCPVNSSDGADDPLPYSGRPSIFPIDFYQDSDQLHHDCDNMCLGEAARKYGNYHAPGFDAFYNKCYKMCRSAPKN